MRLIRILLFLFLSGLLLSCGSSGGSTSNDEEVPEVSVELVSPVNNAVSQELEITAIWSGEATSFNFYFGEDALNLKLIKTTANTNYTVDSLEYSTTYYWQVEAENGETSKKSEVWSFKTQKKTLYLDNFSPQNGDTTELSVDFSWQSNAETFLFLWKRENSEAKEITLTKTSYRLEDLNYEQLYYWQVKGIDKDTIIESYVNWFYTKEKPPVFLTYPPRDADSLFTKFYLKWEGKEHLVGFTVYLGTNENDLDSLGIIGKNTASNLDSFWLDSLAYDQKYYWQVVGSDSLSSFYSEIRAFTIKKQPTLDLLSPHDADSTVPVYPELIWSGKYVKKYALFVKSSQNAQDTIEKVLDFTESSYKPQNLQYSTAYSWQVIANDGEVDTISSVWNFTTVAKPTISLISPKPEADSQFTKLGLTWRGREDVEKYYIYFDTSSTDSAGLKLLDSVINTKTGSYAIDTYMVNSLVYEQKYYWQVIGKNAKAVSESPVQSFTVKGQPSLNLQSPADNATAQFTDLALSWSGDNVASYTIALGTDANNLNNTHLTTNTSYAPEGLAYSTSYYWRVTAHDGQVDTISDTRSFTTKMRPEVTLNYPADGQDSLYTADTLRWASQGDIQKYYIYLDTVGTNMKLLDPITDASITSYSISDLTYGQTYYWRIVGFDGQLDTVSTLRSFTVKDRPQVTAQYPANGQDSLYTAVTLRWASQGGITSHRILMGPSPSDLELKASIGSQDSLAISGLTYSNTYYWQVIGNDGEQDTASAVMSFTVKGQPHLNLQSPADNATAQFTDLALSWSGDNVASYTIALGTDANNLNNTHLTTNTSYAPEGLAYSTSYYWRVTAHDGQVDTISDTRSFTTKMRPEVTLNYPADGQDSLYTTDTLRWASQGDIQKYYIYLDTVGTNMKLLDTITDASITSYSISDLTYGQTYYWRIVGFDGQLDTVSTLRSFTVKDRPQVTAQYPANGQDSLYTAVTLRWASQGGITSHRILMGPSPSDLELKASIGSQDSLAISGLTYSNTYYWQVIGNDGEQDTASAVMSFTVKGQPHLNLQSPADNATAQFTDLALSWSGDNVASYTIALGTDANNLNNTHLTTNTSYAPEGLAYSTSYYWRVTAHDGQVDTISDTRSFTTKVRPEVTLSYPADGQDSLYTADTLRWASQGDIQKYCIYLDTVGANMNLLDTITDTSITSYSISNLTYGQTYYWRVVGFDGQLDTASTLRSFTVKDRPQVTAQYPANGQDSLYTAVTLRWASQGGITSHRILMGPSPSDLELKASIGSQDSLAISGLTYSNTYYWQVIGNDGEQDTASAVMSFTVKGQPSLNLQSPADNATAQFTDLALSWSGDNVASYTIALGTDANNLNNTHLTTNTSYAPEGLAYSTSYYWRVTAHDGQVDTISDTRSFTTKVRPEVTLSYPADGQDSLYTADTLRWASQGDIQKYCIYLDTVGANMNLLDTITDTSITSYSISNLTYGQTYYWRVVGFDGQLDTASTLRSFTVKDRPQVTAQYPANGQDSLYTAVTLRWASQGGITSHRILMGPSPSDLELKASIGSQDSLAISGLTYSNTYYWQVIGNDGEQDTASAVMSFTVKGQPSLNLQSPADNATAQFTDLALSWSGDNVASYTIALGTDANNLNNTHLTTNTSYAPEGLAYSTSYYWRVTAHDGQVDTISDTRSFTTKVRPEVTLSYPADGQDSLYTADTLRWASQGDIQKYYIYLDTVGTNMKLLDTITDASITSYSISELAYGQTYCWRVVGFDGQLDTASTLRSFTVKDRPQVTAQYPANGQDSLYTAVTLRWASQGGITSHRILMGPSPSDLELKASIGSQDSLAISGLTYSNTYYWQVIGNDGEQDTASAVMSFTVKGQPSLNLQSPADNATAQFTDLALSWSGDNVASYTIALGTDANNLNNTHLTTNTSYAPEGLAYSTSYYWRVTAHDGQVDTISDTRSFTTKVRPEVTLSYPADGQDSLYTADTLRWASQGDIQKYYIYLDTVGTNMKLLDTITDASITSYSISELAYGQTYCWRVVGFDGQLDTASTLRSFTVKDRPQVTAQYPANGQDSLYTAVTLRWASQGGITSHRILMGPSPSDLELKASIGSQDSLAISGLTYSNTYYWQVIGNDGEQDTASAVMSFTVKGQPHLNLQSPADNATAQFTDLALSWSGDNVASYTIALGTDANNLNNTHLTTNTSYAPEGLAYSTSYYWRVTAHDGQVDTISDTRSFTTKVRPEVTLSYPADGQDSLYTADTLRWASQGDIQKYCIYLDTVGANMNLLDTITDTSITSYSISDLTYGQTYYWRVVGFDGQLDTASTLRSFTVKDRPQVTAQYPANGQDSLYTAVTLRWASQGGITSHRILMGPSPSDLELKASIGSQDSLAISGLTYSNTYYWQVIGNDGEQDTASAVMSFTVKGQPSLNLQSPADNATAQFTDLALSWSGDNVASYTIALGTDANNLNNTHLTTNTSYAPEGLAYSTSYYWRVTAHDGQVDTISDTRSFTTKVRPEVTLSYPADGQDSLYTADTLRWASQGDIQKYYIYLDTVGTNMKLLDTITDASITSYSISELAYGQTYCWRVVGFDGQLDTASTLRSFTVKDRPQVTAQYPANGQDSLYTAVTLRWASQGGITSHRILMGPSPSDLELKASIGSQDSLAISGLTYSNTYYWQVIGNDGEQDTASAVMSFTVKGQPSLNLQSPADNATAQFTDLALSWSGDNVASYTIALGTDASNLSNTHSTTNTSYAPEGLAYSTSYYWYVVASDGDVDTISPMRSFTTKMRPEVTLNYPADGQDSLYTADTLRWASQGDIQKYYIYLDTVGTNMKLLDTITDASITSYSISELAYGQTYCWRVVGFDGQLDTASTLRSFTVKGEPKVTLISPEGGEEEVERSLSLKWSGANVDDYTIFVGTVKDSLVEKSTAQEDTTYLLSELDYGQTYYWQIVGTDGQISVNSYIDSFTVKNFVTTSILSPVSGENVYKFGIELDWDGEMEFSDLYFGSSPENLVKIDSQMTTTSYFLPEQDYDSEYYWKVVGRVGKTTCSTGVYSFKTNLVNRTMLDSLIDANVDITGANVTPVIDMSDLFLGNAEFNQDISGWDVSNVTDMGHMFYGAKSFNQDISKWEVGNVTDIRSIFAGATVFDQDISGWDVAQVNFANLDSLFTFDNNTPETWMGEEKPAFGIALTGKEEVAKMIAFRKNVTKIDVSAVTDMSHLMDSVASYLGQEISNCSIVQEFNQDISGWDVSNVTDMRAMLAGASSYDQDISGWDVAQVNFANLDSLFTFDNNTPETWMGEEKPAFGIALTGKEEVAKMIAFRKNVTKIDVSAVTDMSALMCEVASYLGQEDRNCPIVQEFNQNISGWNVSNVTDMRHMFCEAKSFNQDICRWNVEKVTCMNSMFEKAESFNQLIHYWKVDNVDDMEDMFCFATSFNKDISRWNTENVTNMRYMFYAATSFNQNISNWKVDKVEDSHGFSQEACEKWSKTWKPTFPPNSL